MARYLEAAEQALAYVDSLRVDVAPPVAGVPSRVKWRHSDDADAPADRSLYYGSAGIVLALLEHHALTGSVASRDLAVAAGQEMVEWLGTVMARGQALSVSLASGWPGYAFTLAELAVATGRSDFRDVAAECLVRLRAQATTLGNGIGWIEPMPFSEITGMTGDREIFDQSVGAAGAGLGLLHAHRLGLHADSLAWARQVGARLLEVAEPDPAGLRWTMMADMPFPFTAPNFAHGGAGVAYFLAQLFTTTGEARFLDAAIAGANYVLSRGTPVGDDGLLVCHTEEARTPIYYLGTCHGPAGTGRTFMLLSDLTGDAIWRGHAERLLRGVRALGAPEQRSKGFWNNHGQCCGDAGIGDFALLMWRRTGDAAHLELARRCADVLLAQGSAQGAGRCWRHAEHRDDPAFVQAQAGYMQGAAGIASFLMHLQGCIDGRPVKLALPDWQFEPAAIPAAAGGRQA